MRRLLMLLLTFVLAGIGSLLWLRSRPGTAKPGAAATAVPVIDKHPPVISTRRFDPGAPPPDMPPLRSGEQAQCDSNFTSGARVSGQTRRTGASTATLTVTQVRMSLGLEITIWVPDAVTQKVLEHEEGHRQISEIFYRDAEKIAGRVAASYLGREYEIAGPDLQLLASEMLQQVGNEITAEYTRQVDPGPAQLRYDAITDHARNDVLASNAVAQALRQ